MMRIYEDNFKTPAINIKWALKDIAKGIWKPSKYAIEDLAPNMESNSRDTKKKNS